MKSFRLHRPEPPDPNDRWEQKKRRWRLMAGSCFGIFVSGFLLWKLFTDARSSTEVKIVGAILLPLGLVVSIRYLILCFRRKADDPIYVEIEKHAD